jgi:hypothetical protein
MKPEMIAHWRNLAKYDGKHLPVLDAACVPQVWVIDGKFPKESSRICLKLRLI